MAGKFLLQGQTQSWGGAGAGKRLSPTVRAKHTPLKAVRAPSLCWTPRSTSRWEHGSGEGLSSAISAQETRSFMDHVLFPLLALFQRLRSGEQGVTYMNLQ